MTLEYGTQRTKNVLDPRIPMRQQQRHREDSVASLRRGVNGPSIACWQSESCFQPQTVRVTRGAPSRPWSLSPLEGIDDLGVARRGAPKLAACRVTTRMRRAVAGLATKTTISSHVTWR